MREAIRATLAIKTVGIAGAGGLGSNCAAALVRAGVGRLIIADFDVVTEANLDRQFYFRDQVGQPKVTALADNLARIDPTARVVAVNERLDADAVLRVFVGCDVVVEAFDQAEAKAMIAEAVLGRMPGTPLVVVSGLAGYGRADDIRARRSGLLVVVGDLVSEVSDSTPPMAPRVGVAANMEADIVLEFLLSGSARPETKERL